MPSKTTIEISTTTIWKAIVIGLFFAFAYYLRDVLAIVFFSIVVASGVEPFAAWFETRNVPRLLSVLVLYLVFFSFSIILLTLIVPFFSFEVSELTKNLPSYVTSISGALDKVQNTSAARYFDVFTELQNFLDVFSQFLQVSSRSVFSLIATLFGGVFSFIAVVIISFYLAIMPKGMVHFIRSIIPDEYEEYFISLWRRSERKVGRWFQGQLLLASSVGLVVFVGLSLFGIEYALILSILAMVMELIPIAGPVIAAIPAVLVGFSVSPSMGLWILGFYIIVQQLESHVLAPYILGKTLGLNPLTVIIALLVGGKIAGIVGIILSVPAAVVLVEIFDDIAAEKEIRRSLKAG